MQPDADSLVGQVVDGYKVERIIGQGSMGKVYYAVDIDSKRPVALKTMSKEHSEDQELLMRFQREARVANEIKHPNVAHVLMSSDYYDMPYLVMEYIDGPALDGIVKENGALDPNEAIEIIKQAAEGLKAATKHGSLHRDIKPANIMMTSQGVVKIVDFGIARNQGDALKTAMGVVMGSPYFMSPEQSAAKELDHRSDIFSLGGTMYYLLTGIPPFKGRNLVEVIQMRAKGDLRPIESFKPSMPKAVCEVCYKMMKTDPKDRFKDYDDLIKALNAAQKKLKKSPSQSDSVEEMATQVMQQPSLGRPAAPSQPQQPQVYSAPSPQQSQPSDQQNWPSMDSGQDYPSYDQPKGILDSDWFLWAMLGIGAVFILIAIGLIVFS